MHHKLGTENALPVEKAFLRWVQREQSKERKQAELGRYIKWLLFQHRYLCWATCPFSGHPRERGLSATHQLPSLHCFCKRGLICPCHQRCGVHGPFIPAQAAAALPALLGIWPQTERVWGLGKGSWGVPNLCNILAEASVPRGAMNFFASLKNEILI